MTALIDAAAVVLAGGRSSRMGTPKALLPFDDRPLISHVVVTLNDRFGEVVVVAAPGQDLPPLAETVVRDDVPFQGPVGGIYYGLRAIARDVAFVTSCDSPFLNPELIAHVVGQAEHHDVVVPRWQGRFQPLHAAYRRSLLPLLEDQLARAELRPVSLFDKVRTCVVEEADVRRFDPDGASFFNMNSPAEYADALERWRRLRDDSSGPPEASACTVELFGVARMLAKKGEIVVSLQPGATCAQVFAAVADELPALAGRVIAADGAHLIPGYACNLNGLEFVRSPSTRVNPGDRILILAADAGG